MSLPILQVNHDCPLTYGHNLEHMHRQDIFVMGPKSIVFPAFSPKNIIISQTLLLAHLPDVTAMSPFRKMSFINVFKLDNTCKYTLFNEKCCEKGNKLHQFLLTCEVAFFAS